MTSEPAQISFQERRLAALRAALVEQECDAYISVSPPANQYLTGFQGSTSAVLVTLQDAFFFCDFRYTEQAQTQVAGYAVEEQRGALESRLAERMKALALTSAAYDPGAWTVRAFGLVQAEFTGKLASAPQLLAGLRQCKDPEEIAAIRAASHLAESALTDLLPELRAGVTEREFAARLEYEFKYRGASGASFDSIVLFGAQSALPHGKPRDKVLKPGENVLIDCGCVRNGYCSDLTRTYIYDRISAPWFEEIYAVTLSAQEAGLAAVRPGARCRDVDAAARGIIEAAGYGANFGHGLGHGVGVEVHEAPRLNADSEAVLLPGMVVTVEPGIYLPGRGGVRIEDLVVVTDTGCEVLTQSAKQLEVLGT